MNKRNRIKPHFYAGFCVFLLLSACSHEANHQRESISEVSLTSTISSAYLGSYEIVDEQHNTQVKVVVSEDSRTITSNALPNHVTGLFPNKGNPNTISAQSRKWVLPLKPEYTGCLLYTSPSPRDKRQSRMPSSA